MTNADRLTPAQLAILDQRLAAHDVAVDEFIKETVVQIGLDGRAIATAAIADSLARQLDEDQLASIAAIALVRLAELPGAGGGS